MMAEKPHTLWNDAMPDEYGYYSNVDPTRPHPRWSQSTERLLVSGKRVATRLYNGYETEVEGLHKTIYKQGNVF